MLSYDYLDVFKIYQNEEKSRKRFEDGEEKGTIGCNIYMEIGVSYGSNNWRGQEYQSWSEDKSSRLIVLNKQ